MNKKLESKYTENLMTACEEGIKHGKVIQGENFQSDVYAIYDTYFNGFYLYKMQNGILTEMTDTVNGCIPIPWVVSQYTASQKYAILNRDEIPKL